MARRMRTNAERRPVRTKWETSAMPPRKAETVHEIEDGVELRSVPREAGECLCRIEDAAQVDERGQH